MERRQTQFSEHGRADIWFVPVITDCTALLAYTNLQDFSPEYVAPMQIGVSGPGSGVHPGCLLHFRKAYYCSEF